MDRRSFLGGLAAGAFFSSLPGRIANAATADNLAELDMIATAALIERKEVKASEVALAAMRRIDTLNPRLNALVTKSYKQAMRRAVLGQTGPLAGVPYALKDLNWQEGVRYTQGS
ncbi:MAG: amidase family protein, partial [Hyphomicrobiales bacterium]|nr:amidase family protein [Hyphomicrobiales bacterium]